MCDNYLSYAELLRILVINKCGKQHLVSLQHLDSKDKARRLRDALTEEHRFPLAMEVATKCQVCHASVAAMDGRGVSLWL